jgi:hypothetical protein
MAYFELRTPADMLNKVRREHARLMACTDIDNVFNFFVTAYHIKDYIEKTNAVTQYMLDTFLSDRDIKDCHDLCDKGKHMRLTTRTDPIAQNWHGGVGGAPVGIMTVNGGDKWMLFSDSRTVEVEALSSRVLLKWEQLFNDNKLTAT